MTVIVAVYVVGTMLALACAYVWGAERARDRARHDIDRVTADAEASRRDAARAESTLRECRFLLDSHFGANVADGRRKALRILREEERIPE